ncbi:MAG TPA: winged helix-turn-helix domain-containing protein [Micromonosporaceae bacterium]
MDVDELANRLAAVANPHRLRILAQLASGSTHVSELARRLGMSRALLYMHIRRLEEAGFVSGHLELSADGKALKYFAIVPFEVLVDIGAVVAAVKASPALGGISSGGLAPLADEGDQRA